MMKNRSLSTKLVLCFLLVIVVTLTLTTGVSVRRLGSILQDSYDDSGELTLNLMEKSIEDTLVVYEKIAWSLIGNDDLNRMLSPRLTDEEALEYSSYITGILSAQIYSNRHVNSIIINCKGSQRQYTSTMLYSQRVVDFLSTVDTVMEGDAARSNGQLVWMYLPSDDPARMAPDNIDRVVLIGTIKDREYVYQNQEIATFLIEMDVQLLYGLYQDVRLAESGFAGLVDAGGKAFPESRAARAVPREVLGEIARTALLGEGATVEMDGGYTLHTAGIRRADWILYVAVSHADVLRQTKGLAGYFYLIAVLVLALSLVFAVGISMGITRPIKALTANMSRVQQGDFGSRIQVDRRDEVGRLSESFNEMVERLGDLIREVYEVRVSEKEAQILAMQAQLNPHFIYNTLDVINWTVILGEQGAASDMITSLSDMLRYTIGPSPWNVTVGEELEHVRRYLAIYQKRMADKLHYTIDVEEEATGLMAFKFFLQPIVENAIVHGFRDLSGVGELSIEGKRQGERLLFTVTDNGIGMDAGQVASLNGEGRAPDGGHASIGIPHVRDHIRLMYGGGVYGVFVHSRPGEGTRVEICLPVIFVEGGNTLC